jgi:hypothetical protein
VNLPAAVPPPSSKPPVATWSLGNNVVQLTGSNVSDDVVAPGHSIEVSLQWRTPQQPQSDYYMRLAVLNNKGQPISGQTLPMSPAYPTSRWRAGQEMMAKYSLLVPEDLEKGRYYVAVSPADGPETAVPSLQYVQVSPLDVVPLDGTYTLPTMQHTLGARVGGKADLAGFDISGSRVKPADTLQITLYWRTIGKFDRGYKVFNHVIDDANVFAGQRDAIPVDGSRPTTTWNMGEVLVDKYEVKIAPGAKAGNYHLKIGMYAQDGGERLQIAGSDGTPLGDSISLATVEVAP